MYFDKSKLRAASKLESNYDIIVKDYNNFNYTFQDRLGKFKIDTLFKKWRGLYEFSLQVDKKNVFQVLQLNLERKTMDIMNQKLMKKLFGMVLFLQPKLIYLKNLIELMLVESISQIHYLYLKILRK